MRAAAGVLLAVWALPASSSADAARALSGRKIYIAYTSGGSAAGSARPRSATIASDLQRLLVDRGATATVLEPDLPTEERLARIASRGGGLYVEVACVPRARFAVRVRYPRMPAAPSQGEQGSNNLGSAVQRAIAVRRAEAGAGMAKLVAEQFGKGVGRVELVGFASDMLDTVAGTAILVDLSSGDGQRSKDLCVGNDAAAALAGAIERALTAQHSGHP